MVDNFGAVADLYNVTIFVVIAANEVLGSIELWVAKSPKTSVDGFPGALVGAEQLPIRNGDVAAFSLLAARFVIWNKHNLDRHPMAERLQAFFGDSENGIV